MLIKEIKGSEKFEKIYNSTKDKKLIIKFFSNNCKPCKEIQPYLEKLSGKYKDIVFIMINTSNKNNDIICDTYKIEELPTLVCLCYGKVRKIIIGSDKKIIKKQISWINKFKKEEEVKEEDPPLDYSSDSHEKFNYSSE